MAQLQRSPVVPIVVTVLILVGLGLFAAWSQTVPGPTIEFANPPHSIGRTAAFELTAQATRGGVRWVEARLQRGEEEISLGRVDFNGPAENTRHITLTIDTNELALTEGDAFLKVYGADGFWRLKPSSDPLFSAPVRVDLTPPPLHVLSATRYPQQGGAGISVLRSEEDARVAIILDEVGFPASTPVGLPPDLRVGLFAIPWDFKGPTIVATATDAAGNVTRRELPVVLKTRRFEHGTVNIKRDFVERKAAELLPVAESTGDVAELFVKINRELRATGAEQKRAIGRDSSPQRLWANAFQQPKNTRVFSNFAESRDYRLDGQTVDTQVHLGFDLASVQQAAIPAANSGRVVFAGPMGIYGNTVILDHGWGLQSLYAHCSTLNVGVGDEVRQGQEIARTGATGLAVGDHLHYEVMVRGVPVSPLQWWDGQWVKDHILQVLRDGGIQPASR